VTPVPLRPTGAKLEVRGVTKTFASGRERHAALAATTLEVGDGEFVCLVGPSGCGKTTLLNLIAGLDSPDTGVVLADGEPVRGPGGSRMVMFQDAALFPWLTALGNVEFGLRLKHGLDRAARRAIARRALDLVGLADRERAAVHELSGGMRQRVALARALAPEPRVLLMDEPFGALDALTREQLYRDLQDIWRRHRKTVVFVTHNVREAVCLGDRVLVLSPPPGRPTAELRITLPRPRDMSSVALARVASEITAALGAAACRAA